MAQHIDIQNINHKRFRQIENSIFKHFAKGLTSIRGSLKFEQLDEVILNNGEGFTIDLNGNAIKKDNGFFISITHIKGKRLNHLIRKVLYIKRFGFNHLKNLFIGGWKEDIFYLDLSLWVDDLHKAVYLAGLFNQKAIYDLKNLESVYLK